MGLFSSDSESILHPSKRRITLIAYWKGARTQKADYFPAFFESVARQAERVDLLLINFNMSTGADMGCLDIEHLTGDAANIRVVCIPEDDAYTRFADVLCEERTGWDCTAEERQETQAYVRRVKEGDRMVQFKVIKARR